jgi:dephospho-CoA kinase
VTVVIGLTGPIGCGKSTIAGWLGDAGALVIDADGVAREVTAPGEPAHDEVLGRFGPAVRTADGELDRAALARIVFGDRDRLAVLEAIVHPAVRARILEVLEASRAGAAPAVVVEAIKLVEGGLAALCDEVWLVTCEAAAQRARLQDRGLPAEDAAGRIEAQRGLVERAQGIANRVFATDADRDVTRAAVLAAFADATGAGSDAGR